ncbi:hypothetical protein PIROE2DRAFT_14379 [Piromyces sp. E2]|nr:hypothetical protein PIROE2DRAFT_14379 [Piromyces sp. E2]|eukprot:OUM59966.1 hypothetical protein PIROE2DRAFT_14379 [Piromyces sp. E2]
MFLANYSKNLNSKNIIGRTSSVKYGKISATLLLGILIFLMMFIGHELEQIPIDYFFENDNVEWIKNYWKYIEKTGIYQELLNDKSNIENTYRKYDVEIEPILKEAYLIEDIRYDNDFIFIIMICL